MKKSSCRSITAAGGWFWVPVLALLWEVFRFAGNVSPLLMPSLWSIIQEFYRSLIRGDLALRWLVSLAVVAAGLVSGILLALTATMLSRLNRSADSLFRLLSSIMHPLPGLALLPLVILWFGTGFTAILVIIIHAVLWPVFVNLQAGLRSLPESWLLYSRNQGMSPIARFIAVEMPGTFPHLVSGIRTGWARAWRSFIAAEMVFGAIGRNGGLGWQLFESRVMMDTTALYAALIAVIITGLLVEGVLLNRWENRIRSRWGES